MSGVVVEDDFNCGVGRIGGVEELQSSRLTALGAKTGNILWRWYTLPGPVEVKLELPAQPPPKITAAAPEPPTPL
jgi:hypothetical protein